MPSKLVTTTARLLGASGKLRSAFKGAVAQVTQGVQTIQVRGPFLGFQPDVDPNLTDGTAFARLMNVLARAHGEDHGEVLGLPDGYRQLDSARLPLGDGATLPASPVTDADPVVRLDQLNRVAPTLHASPGEYTGEFQLTPLAVTAGDGSTSLSGNMYRIGSNSQWTHVPQSAATSDTRALKGGRDGRTQYPSMGDSCVAPFGATARADNSSADNDDLQSGAIQEPCWIYTNDVDEVMVFPSSSVETLLGTHAYEPLCDETSSPDLDAGGSSGFRAKSCETWNGRVYFLNTSEAGARFSRRLRRTAKFTADPDPTIVGAGHYDWNDFQGDGLRVETLGDILAVYFSDGVACVRPTGVATSPDEPQVLSTERGLLGTHALTSIGRNVHFGIFTDGWWLLDQSGRWQEVGVTQIENKTLPKWRQTFYDTLPNDQRHRIYVYYDQPTNLVYITKPTFDNPDPHEVWIYDPTSDRVFVENYPVTCFGTFTPPAQVGVTIDASVGTIDQQDHTIDSTAPIAGFPKVRVHGDTFGFVYQHRRDISGYDSPTNPAVVQDPTWMWAIGLRSPAGFRTLATVDRVSLEYFNHENEGNVSIETFGNTADGVQTRSVTLMGGVHEDLQYRDAWFRFSSSRVGLRVSGTGEFHIRGVAVDLWTDGLEPRGT